jgi:hypothetical protein
MVLTGCAVNHSLIATTLVRLRHLPAVADVELTKATKPVDVNAEANGGAPGTGAAADPAAEAERIELLARLERLERAGYDREAGNEESSIQRAALVARLERLEQQRLESTAGAEARVTAAQAEAAGLAVTTFVQPLHDVDRAVLDGETEGFAKVHVKQGTATIVGATIVTRHAGDMIGLYTSLMTHKLGLGALTRVIQPYPTQAEAVRKTGDAYQRTRLTPLVKKLMARWFAWQRGRLPR